VKLLDVRQAHLGTDGGLALIKNLTARLREMGAEISLGEEMLSVEQASKTVVTDKRTLQYGSLVVAPGRGGFAFLQRLMKDLNVEYHDNIVDIGIRIETREEHYPIVHDYYDPKFLFPKKNATHSARTRAPLTSSRSATATKRQDTGIP